MLTMFRKDIIYVGFLRIFLYFNIVSASNLGFYIKIIIVLC